MAAAVQIFNHFDTPKEPGVYFRLICLTGKNKGKAYFITGNRVVMGRSDDVDVTILDMKSSREHAEIVNLGKSFVLTDLGSQNGVIVNDLKVKQHTLSNGDKIIIGKTVFKFSRVEVKDERPLIERKRRELDEEHVPNEESAPDNKGLTRGLIIIIVVALGALLLTDPGGGTKSTNKRIIDRGVKEFAGNTELEDARKQRDELAKKNRERLEVYFKRGLREFREGNYFRAKQEFEAAAQWNPNDLDARNYLRQTNEKINETIEAYFTKATREADAVKYREAAVAYCNIVKYLSRNKDDSRYKRAVDGIHDLEKKMALEEGEFECVPGGDIK